MAASKCLEKAAIWFQSLVLVGQTWPGTDLWQARRGERDKEVWLITEHRLVTWTFSEVMAAAQRKIKGKCMHWGGWGGVGVGA